MSELQSTLRSLVKAQAGLQLGPLDLCFVIALRAKGEQGSLAAFEEEHLVDTFVQVLALLEPEAEAPRLRATGAIRRLREQRLLTRIDGSGFVRAGEFALTRLADAIAGFFLEEERLTRESLQVLMSALNSQLGQVRERIRAGGLSEDVWRERVIQPLELSASELLSGIERRQRGLDLSQESVREQIAQLLREDWFSAIEACESVLEETATTLRELNDVLLHDSAILQSLLQDIAEFSRQHHVMAAYQAAQRLIDQMDRVSAWGTSRQKAWSEYYRYVQRFLRDVVRLDPSRALTHRLQHQLRHFHHDSEQGGLTFALVAAKGESLPILRMPDVRESRPEVARPIASHEASLENVSAPLPQVVLEEAIQGLLTSKPEVLSAILSGLLAQLPRDERYRAMGRAAAISAEQARVQAHHERPWVEVFGDEDEAWLAEEWELHWPKPDAKDGKS